MDTVTLSAYLRFDGDCRQALELYQSVFGGNVEIQTYGETDPDVPDAMKDRVMHARLSGGAADFMAADEPERVTGGPGPVRLALTGTDERSLRTMFESLSEGGTVVTPLEKQVWGDLYGALTDRFGINWMVNIGTETN